MIITVNVPKQFTINDNVVDFIRSTCRNGQNKVPAIKFLRAEYALDLRSAKDIVDRIIAEDQPVRCHQWAKD